MPSRLMCGANIKQLLVQPVGKTEALSLAETRSSELEAKYSGGGDRRVYGDLQVALKEVMLLWVAAVKKQLLYLSQRIFEQGRGLGACYPSCPMSSLPPHKFRPLGILMEDC